MYAAVLSSFSFFFVVDLRLGAPLVDVDAVRAAALKSFPSLALNPVPPFPLHFLVICSPLLVCVPFFLPR